jgi:hypothetical protein
LLALLLAGGAALPVSAFAQAPASAYLDEGARELVRLARLRRTMVDRRIEAYETTARERMSVGLRLRIAERLLYRRESAARIQWSRGGPTRIEILGARGVAPPVKGVPEVPIDLQQLVPHLAFDPTDSQMLLRVDTAVIRHPLGVGSEAHYRFESGDTTVIRLPDGRTVRLHELRVLPRRRDFHLVNGSFWLDAETHAVVQAYFRLAREFDLERDNTEEEDLPGFLEPIRADLEFVALEYGLWELRWWLPRLIVARGMVQVGPFRMPLSYERTYGAYHVRGDTAGVALVPADTTPEPPCRRVRGYNITIDPAQRSDSVRQAWRDSLEVRRARRREEMVKAAAMSPDSLPPCEDNVIVTVAGPDSVLLRSPELPPSVYEGDVALIPESELRDIIDRVRAIGDAPWQLVAPRFAFGLGGAGLARYNRVEGLSVGGRMELDLGPASLLAEARLGVADLEPRGELALMRPGQRFDTRFAAYRRLAVAPIQGAHGIAASLGALLFGRDDAEYYDALGAELVVRPPVTRTPWYDLRLYAERQRAVERNTDFSIAHLIDSDDDFPPNMRADAADQLGAALRLRASVGRNTARPRWSGELSFGGELGDFALFRPEASLRFSTPLPLGLAFGLETGAGTVAGDSVPAQALWRLGGARTIRGYAGGTILGDSYWRARAELARGWPAARFALFSDAAWAGPRDAFGTGARGERSAASGRLRSDAESQRRRTGDPLLAAGAGISLLDGLFRIDLARALRAPTGWRLHVYFDGVL